MNLFIVGLLSTTVLVLTHALSVPVNGPASAVDQARLIIMPRAYEGNKVKATLDEAFSLSCLTENDQSSPNGLRWLSPNSQVIETISTATSVDLTASKRVYTIVKKNQISINFDKVMRQDAGVYACQAMQDGVTIQVKVELELEKKISFQDTPLQQFLPGGQDKLVICHASAIPGPEISWFRKGIYIELKNDHKYQITNDGLMIKNAQPEDEGVYYCKATVTSTGEVKRAEIDVRVMAEPRWITQPVDTDGVKDQDVVIKCEVFAKPPAVYKWLRDGIQLVGSRYITTSNSLRITQLTRYDTGTYTCFAENISGHIQGNFRLNVLVGPALPLIEDVHVVEGNKAVLRCVVQEAFPKAQIKWRFTDAPDFINPTEDKRFEIHDDSDLDLSVNPIDGNIVGSWSELIIERADRKDRRNFTCVASNKAALAERSVQLLVEYKPTLLLNEEVREVYYSWLFTDSYGSSGSESSQPTRSYPAVLTCLADGEPRPTITWFFKTQRIKHDNLKYRLIRDEPGLSKIEINPKSVDDFGDYQCNAENRQGFEQRNMQLRQATPPRFAPYVFLKSVHPDSLLVDIKPSEAVDADGGMPIEAYRIQWRYGNLDWTDANQKEIAVVSNSVEHLVKPTFSVFNVEIGALLPDTEYLIRVAAMNKPGQGVWSTNLLKAKTSPRRQPDPVRLSSKEDCQASSRCYIEWVVDSSGGSPIREFLIRWRRISYKDSLNQHVNTDKIEAWSTSVSVQAPLSNYEIANLQPDSFYEVEILARNDIGPSASQPFRIRTLPGQLADLGGYSFVDRTMVSSSYSSTRVNQRRLSSYSSFFFSSFFTTTVTVAYLAIYFASFTFY